MKTVKEIIQEASGTTGIQLDEAANVWPVDPHGNVKLDKNSAKRLLEVYGKEVARVLPGLLLDDTNFKLKGKDKIETTIQAKIGKYSSALATLTLTVSEKRGYDHMMNVTVSSFKQVDMKKNIVNYVGNPYALTKGEIGADSGAFDPDYMLGGKG